MPDEFKIGDRVEHVPYPLNTLYKPGPGTVTNVSPTRVVVLWGRRCDRSSRNSRNRCTRPRTIADDPTWRRPRNYRPHHLKLVTRDQAAGKAALALLRAGR